MARDLIGVNLGRYQVVELVGRGGMASVYRAHDPRLSRQVAVKVPHPHLASDPDFSARFLREARAVAALRHPNIVQVFDFGEEGDTTFMVMELIEGPTLATVLAEQARLATPLGPGDVVVLGSAMGSAIDYAAARGMIHRDIKPSNIILEGGVRPVLTDYGIARILGATTHTVAGVVVGSAHYMSPEQAQALPLDARSDLYSLAVVLFEALAGRVPFDADTTMAILTQHMTVPAPSVRSYNPSIPAGFDPVLTKALAKVPADRYQDGAQLAEALHAAIRGPSQTAGHSVEDAAALQTTAGGTRVDLPVQAPSIPAAAEPAAAPQAPVWHPNGGPTAPGRRAGARRMPTWALLLAALAVIGALTAVIILATRNGGETTTTVAAAEEQERLAEADALLWGGQILDASTQYLAILQANPSFAPAHRQLGIAYYMMSDSDYQAETQLHIATEALPDDAVAAAFLGQTISRRQRDRRATDFTEAEQWLRRAVQLDEKSELPHAFLAEMLAAAGRTEGAQQEAETALALNSTSSWAQFGAGITHAFADEWDQALPFYTQAVVLNPSWPHLYPALIEALRYAGSYEEALEYCATLQKLGQGYEAEALADKAFTLKDAGDTQGAIEAFNASLAIDDTDDYTHWGLGSLLYREGSCPEALPHLQRAAALAPAEPAYHAWAAWCLLELQQYDEARAAAQKALDLDPANEDAQGVLEELDKLGV